MTDVDELNPYSFLGDIANSFRAAYGEQSKEAPANAMNDFSRIMQERMVRKDKLLFFYNHLLPMLNL